MTAYDLAQRYVGQVIERKGDADHPLVQWWLSLCGYGMDAHDEVPWCSAFVNGIAWELRLPRSKSAAARSWLSIGEPIGTGAATAGFDILVLNRGGSADPTMKGPGHVTFYAGKDATGIFGLGGNQSNGVTVAHFKPDDILGLRRLRQP